MGGPEGRGPAGTGQCRAQSPVARRLPRVIGGLVPHLAVACLITAYFVRFALLSVQVQDGFGAPGYDMGIFDQGVWLLSHFHAPFVTVMGRDLFGDHTSFIVLLAVPLYWIWPEAQTLLVLQAALIAAAAVPVYLLGRRRTGSTALATALAAAYLLNPALQNANLEQFHPECFLVLFAAWALYAALEWRPLLLAVSVAGCLLVKEDTALLVVPLGLWVHWRRDRAWGSAVVTTALAYMAFAYGVVIESLLGTTSFYMGRLPFGGLYGLLAEPFTHPGRFWAYLGGGNRPWYLWQMAASFGGVFLLAPDVAAVGAAVLAENVVSNMAYMHQIYYHYSLVLVAVLAMATVCAVARLGGARRRAVATAAATGAALASCVVWGLAPFSLYGNYAHLDPSGARVRAIDQALQAVPPAAVVSAAYPYVSHLDHRLRIYQWPTPFRATYWGLYGEEGRRLPFASSVQYVVVPDHLSGVGAHVLASIRPHFRLVASGGGVDVYRRAKSAPEPAGTGGHRPG